MKDVPFFPYAPYIPQTEMSVTGASFSQKHVQLPPVEEEDEQEEAQERVEDNERVGSPSVLAALITPLISCATSTAVQSMQIKQGTTSCHPTWSHKVACVGGEYVHQSA